MLLVKVHATVEMKLAVRDAAHLVICLGGPGFSFIKNQVLRQQTNFKNERKRRAKG